LIPVVDSFSLEIEITFFVFFLLFSKKYGPIQFEFAQIGMVFPHLKFLQKESISLLSFFFEFFSFIHFIICVKNPTL
jgi:hypothetical protein